MPFFDAIRIGASGAADTTYTVNRSLRFNNADSEELINSSLGTSPTSRRKHTISFWFKRVDRYSSGMIMHGYSGSGASQSGAAIRYTGAGWYDADQLIIENAVNNSNVWALKPTMKFRDFSAWYHLVVAIDTTQGTASDRVKVYVNGVQVTAFDTATYPSQDYDNLWLYNTARVGAWDNGGSYYAGYNGYLAEYHAIDGQQLTPSSFAETDSTTGEYKPIKYTGSYGNNGHYLNFSDNSGTSATTLGKDSSGNSKNFTPNNFATNDAVKDSPTNNFCTFNPLSNYDELTLAEGNLKATSSSSWKQTRGTMGVSSGKWYFEIRCNSIAATEGWIAGIHEVFARDTDGYYWYNNSYTAAGFGYAYGVQDNNQKRGNTSSMDGSFSSDVTAGKVVGIRMNLDDNEILISVDGADKGKMYDIQSGITYAPAVNIYSSSSATLNCGQDSTFHGQESSGGNTDSGGIGDFAYAVPSGYKALCSANLPEPAIAQPNKYFDTVLYSGTGSSQNITGLEFQPDWVWIKKRSNSENHELQDAVRGATKRLTSSANDAESTVSGSISAFNSNGFTVVDAGTTNESGETYVAWNWNAGDTDGKTYTVKVVSDSGNKYRFDDFGTSAVTLDLAEGGTYIFDQSDSSNSGHPLRFSTTSDGTHGSGSEYTTGVTTSGTPGSSGAKTTIVVAASAPTLYYYCTQHSGMGGQANTNSTLGSSNFDGATQAVVKASPTAGISIVSYTGTGDTSETYGHGLGVKPDCIIVKCRNTAGQDWVMYHKDLNGGSSPAERVLKLNSTAAEADLGDVWYDTEPTSSVFTVGDEYMVNGSSSLNYVAYCFSGVASFSKFGSYTGNGSDDGTFVFTGFSVAWLMVKRSDGSSTNWTILDNKRDTSNVAETRLFANDSSGDSVSSGGVGSVDFLSNGFKARDSHVDGNGSSANYIYLAFAEAPFRNARAR